MHKIKGTGLIAAALLLVLAGCGGSGDAEIGTGGGGTTPGDDDDVATALRSGWLSDAEGFQEGVIGLTASELAAGGQTGLRVDVVNASGQLAADASVTVSFTSDCLASSLSVINPASVTTTNGRAEATYIAQGCSGSDTIRATVTSDTDPSINTSSAVVTVQAGVLGSIEFISATPSIIGMAGSPLPKQSVLVFKLTNASGGPAVNQSVSFALSGTLGGADITPKQAVSDNQGLVQTVLTAGSVRGTVQVKATSISPLSGAELATTSDQLAISTGLPDQDSFSLSADKLSVAGGCDGEPVNLNIRLADRYNNPAPLNTAASFTTEGGKINAQCFTGDPLGDPTAEAGACTVLLTVQQPRPANGRVTVLATAVGEEAFADGNGNGFYDAGEAFGDLGDAFVDYSEDGVKQSDEPVVDFEGDGFDASGDGEFTGYVCNSPGVNCRSNTLNVRDDIVIVFSTSSPVLDALQVGVGGPSTYDGSARVLTFRSKKVLANVVFTIRDTNGNPLPTGTTFGLTSSIGSVLDPATVGPFNSNDSSPAANTYGFTLQSPDSDEPDSGIVSAVVTIPASACDGARTVTLPLFSVIHTPPAEEEG